MLLFDLSADYDYESRRADYDQRDREFELERGDRYRRMYSYRSLLCIGLVHSLQSVVLDSYLSRRRG